MTAFQKGIVSLGAIFGFLWFWNLQVPNMRIVYPDNCIFTLDNLFSRPMQLEIKKFIDQAYKKSKMPSHILLPIESHFKEIKSIVIDMNNPEALHFTIQAYQPLFIVNNEQVICQYGKMYPQHVFSSKALQSLENISFQGALTPVNQERLVQFFQSLSTPILKNFSIRWMHKHDIWLDSKDNKDNLQNLALLVSYQRAPTEQDIQQCRHLRGQMSDKPAKDKRGRLSHDQETWVCDLRFDQQIVVFSTKRGV